MARLPILGVGVPAALAASFFVLPFAHAAETDVGDVLEAAGAPQFLVRAGDAVRATCLQLGAAQPSLTAPQAELFDRCRDMSGTVLDGANSFGFDAFGDVLNALRHFSGEEVSSQGRLATEGSNRQFAAIGARIDAIRRGARSLGSGLAFNDRAGGPALALHLSHVPRLGGGASADRDADTGWGWFGNAEVGFGDRDHTASESGYDYNAYGLTLGADYAFGSGLAVGVAVGYRRHDTDFDSGRAASLVTPVGGGGIDSDGYSVSAFFTWPVGRFYMTGIASGGGNSFDMVRVAQFDPGPDAVGRPAAPGFTIDRTFRSSTDSRTWSTQASAGTVFGEAATTLDLYGAIEFMRINVDGFAEREIDNAGLTPSPGLALRFRSQRIESLQSVFGLMLRRALNMDFGVLIPYAGAEWRHEFDNDSRVVDYRYLHALSDISFRTPTDDPDRDYFELTGGLSAQFANNFFGFAEYRTTVGLANTTAHLLTFGIRGVF
jgi:outer membrane lipase/esterase